MITSNDKKFIDKCKLLIAHVLQSTFQRERVNKPWIKISILAGHNFRMSNISRKVMRLKKINKLNSRRILVAKIFKILKGVPNILLPTTIMLLILTRLSLYLYQKSEKIVNIFKSRYRRLRAFYTCFASTKLLKYRKSMILKNAEILSESSISLPIYPDMKDQISILYVKFNFF